MKKKKLNKKLDLGKKQISNLGDKTGGAAASHLTCTVGSNFFICNTKNIYDCTWYSELYTACTCPPSWDLGCNSNGFVCEVK